MSSTSVEASGLVGNLLKKAGTDTLTEESFFTETTMATKNKTSRSIIDLNAETITAVNDVTKTYTVIPFDQVGAMVAPGGETAPAEPEEDADYTVSGPIDTAVFEISEDYEQTDYYGTGGN